MSIYDTLMGDTVGIVWRAGTGTVDPWTKANLQQDETAGLVKASGSSGQYDQTSAAAQAQNDVTSTLRAANADPSQALAGLKNSLSEAFSLSGSLGKTMLFVGIGGLLLVIAFERVTR